MNQLLIIEFYENEFFKTLKLWSEKMAGNIIFIQIKCKSS